jgi:RNA polymerase sigma factor (sigma-70 family)
MLEDAELLRRYVAEKSEAAFVELVTRYLDLVYSAALRQVYGDRHRAEDVSQVVFTALARKAPSLAPHPVLAGWLYTATQHAAAKAVRTEARRHAREQEAYTMQEAVASNSAADVEIDWDRVRPVLDAAMRELNDRDREAVLLRFFAHRAFAEIGRALGLSEDAARMRVDRALEKLHGLLGRRGITSTTAALATVFANQATVAAPAGLAASVTGAALAGVAGSVGTLNLLAAGLQFMMTSKTALGVATTLLLAVALGTATRESRARQAAVDGLAQTMAEVALLENQAREQRQRVSAAEETLQHERNALAAAEQAATRNAASARRADPIEAGNRFFAQHPEARGLFEELSRAEIANSLVAHYRVVNPTPEQRAQIETIFASPMRTVSLPDGPMTLRSQRKLTPAEMEAEARRALGDEPYAQLMTTGRSLSGGVDLAVQFAGATYRTEPLTEPQMDAMLRIFATAQAGALKNQKTGERAGVDWTAIEAEAAGLLSPPQIAALVRLRRIDENERAVQQALRPSSLPPSATKASPSPAR